MPYYGDECDQETMPDRSEDGVLEERLNTELGQAEKRLAVLRQEEAQLTRIVRGCRAAIEAMNAEEVSAMKKALIS